jgi:hypothetical protein
MLAAVLQGQLTIPDDRELRAGADMMEEIMGAEVR